MRGGLSMLSNLPKRGLSLILIATMVGIGTVSYIPPAFAEDTATVQENPAANTLSKLEIAGGKLDKDFSAEINEYSATVENEIQSIYLLTESSNKDSIITINGQSITGGTASPFSLQTGKNKFLITVKDGNHSENTYTLTVTRKQNANNFLQTIKLSAGELSPLFSAAVTDYTVQVPNDTAAITVSPTALKKTATVEVNGLLVRAEGVTAKVPVGKSNILIVVTAENGVKKTYTIHVTRETVSSYQAANPSPNKRNNSIQSASLKQTSGTVEKESKATLSSLTVSDGTWDSIFSKSEFTYHVAVSSNVKTITINPTANYSGSTFLMDGTSSKTIQLEDDGKTIISVAVSNGDDDRKTYVLVFDQEK